MAFRRDPIPKTGKKSGVWRWRDSYHFSHTTQEKRWSEAHRKFVRARRRLKSLDRGIERCRGDWGNRSWKAERKKQWHLAAKERLKV